MLMRKAGYDEEGGRRHRAPPGTPSLALQLVETKGFSISAALNEGDSQ